MRSPAKEIAGIVDGNPEDIRFNGFIRINPLPMLPETEERILYEALNQRGYFQQA